MDNMCVFTNWVLKGDVKVATMGNGKKKASFALSSPRPNKAGVWNKNYFVAFDSTAEVLEKCNIQQGCYMTVYAEQQVYTDKEGVMRHNYLVSNFQLPPKSKQQDRKEESSASNQEPEVQEPLPEEPLRNQNGNLQGYAAMMEFMNS